MYLLVFEKRDNCIM